MKKNLFSLTLFLILSPMSISAQATAESKLQSFVSNVEQFAKSFPQEKVYLHLDNTGYFMGERIWFKAYVMREDMQRKTNLSRVLYVDLLDPSGNVVKEIKLRIENGEADGYIDLDKLLVSGFYEIRAYTRYMLNWGSARMFSRVLPILNKPAKEGDYSDRKMDTFGALTRLPDYREEASEGSKKMNVVFYPEGGHLVAGLENHVAFAVTDENGRHFETKGYLESGDAQVCEVSTLREGRGVFTCKPTGEKMTLHLQNKDGRERTFRLPDSELEGCAVHVDALGSDEAIISLKASPSYSQQRLGLVFMNRGKVMRFDELTIGSGKDFGVRKSVLGNGVSQLSLIDKQGNVLATRMVFVNQDYKAGHIDISLENEYLKPYGKVTLAAKAMPGSHFSMSVRDYDTQVDGWQADLASWLLLSSDLKGYIENAKYYVEADDSTHRRASDLLMLVQGWQRYNLPRMGDASQKPLRFSIEKNISFSGTVKRKKKKNSDDVAGIAVWATFVGGVEKGDSVSYYENMNVTDENGYFHILGPDFNNEQEVVLRPEKNNRIQDDLRFYITRGYSPEGRHLFKAELVPIPIDTPYVWNDWQDPDTILKMNEKVFMLGTVRVKGRRIFNEELFWLNENKAFSQSSIFYDCKKEYEELHNQGKDFVDFIKWLEKRNSFFSGGWPTEEEDIRALNGASDQKMVYPRDGMAYKRRPVVWILHNMFNCITFAPSRLKDHHIIVAKGSRMVRPLPDELSNVKSVYISEDPETWKQFLTCPELESYHPVTVFVYGSPGNRWERYRKGIHAITLLGYQSPETFESPDYKVLPALPDFRRTLYWNPNVKVNEKGEARITFYNNRNCRQLVFSAEGFGSDGTPLVY